MKITRQQLISEFLNFFKMRKHAILPNASLIPENDPSCLFITAGMHPLVPYILGQEHPLGKRLASVQRCLRTDDIEKVGDAFHHTFFEMLGNWSLGDYWKEEAIKMSFTFLTEVLKIPIEKISVSCFEGNEEAPKDEESAKIWLSLGIPKDRIFFFGKEKNWWGPPGTSGPCGPDTEMYYYVGKGKQKSLAEKEEDWCEIWNDVFIQYNKNEKGSLDPLPRRVVDTGMGVERMLACLQGIKDNYMTEIFIPVIKELEYLSDKKYGLNADHTRAMRIIADHLRASVFILAENIQPSNVEQGYVLRRLIRRAIRYGRQLNIEGKFCKRIGKLFIEYYTDYPELKRNENFILSELEKEEEKFAKLLKNGIKKFEEISKGKKQLLGEEAFLLYQSYGFPLELTKELAAERRLYVDEKGFFEKLKEHQELSRKSTIGKFKSGLAEETEITTKLHTATHLLNQALREVLGKKVQQCGSNITPERLRFDFNFDRKLTQQEIKQIEELVNRKIAEGLEVKREVMSLEEALKLGAQAVFKQKYPEKVSVYTIYNKDGTPFSIEICAGPHVKNTKELGKFKILKEESVAAGIRRIKAILE
ncbi:MAG: alanine--tRNA ligase [Candidatus Pacearchaeota archaeon]|nr:alanine--tRNA ligase [Candidatus Pacearchaeota archaeon]